MYGQQNLIGVGQAQVLPKQESNMLFVEQLNQQKQQQFLRDKYEQQKKEQDEKELYGLVGDALNLKDFNPVVHERVKQAQIELAKKIKAEKPSYADTYLLAQNKAAELGTISQSLNQADQVIAAQKKEWEGDKRINAGNLEMLARRDILEDLNKNGKIDPNVNYINRALRKYPQYALVDNGEFAQFKFLPEETQKNITGKYKEINKRGGYDQFEWKLNEYSPSLYDFKDNGEEKAPTITVKSEPSGLLDADKNPVPMLSEEAWGRYGAVTSNIIDLDRRLKKKYGDAIDLESPEAEKLRRIEAYKEVEKNTPLISRSRVEKADPAPRISINAGGRQPSKSEVIAGTPLNLKQYPEEGGNYNITKLAPGIKVTGLPDGKTLAAKKILFNPDTKEVTTTDIMGNTETIDFDTFRQNIATINTGVDLSFIDRLRVTGRPTKSESNNTKVSKNNPLGLDL